MKERQTGAALLEALVGVLIFSIGILAVIGMQGTALRTVSDAKYRADASFIANQTLALAWGNPANLSAMVVTDEPVSELPDGKRSVAVVGNRITVTVRWQPPGSQDEHSFVVIGHVAIDG